VKQQSSKWQNVRGRIRYLDYRLSIRAKLTLILIVVPLVIIPFVAISLHYNNISYNTIQGMRNYSGLVRICETISFLNLKIDGNVKNYTVLRDSNIVNETKEDIATLTQLAKDGMKFGYQEEFEKVIGNIEKYSLLLDSLKMIVSQEEIPSTRIARGIEKYKKQYDELMAKIVLSRTESERDSLMGELKKVSRSLDVSNIFPEKEKNPKKTRIVRLLESSTSNIDIINGSILEESKEKIKEYTTLGERAASQGARNIWVVLILTLGFIVYLIIVLPERIVIPIKRFAKIVKQIEKGDLNVSIKGFSRDEIGELVSHFSRMISQVRKVDGLKTQKILESERKFRFLINSISEGVIVLNDELWILTVNKPAMKIAGIESEEVEERSLGGLESLSGLKERLEKLFTTGEKVNDLNFKGIDGKEYIIKVWPVRDAAGKATGVILLFCQ
jgi:PAS domain S-box-containing protein